ncbi:hypothetical protein GCM10009123_20330 [Kangiella japonica]|uniref:GGDEF domain-containing protein n=2 Tax=Kangiella japonica TaxID=647384 RepID=A0ABP3CQE1_9GAMM
MYNPKEDNSLSSPTVIDLYYDTKNTIWALTTLGIDSVEVETLEVTQWAEKVIALERESDPNFGSMQIHAVTPTDNQQLLVLTDDYIASIDKANNRVIRLSQFDPLISNNTIKSFTYLKERLYFLEDNCLVFVDLEGKSKASKCLSAELQLGTLKVDDETQNKILIKGNKGFAVFNLNDSELIYHQVYDKRKSKNVLVLDVLSHNGGYWLATSSGLKFWDATTQSISLEYYAEISDPYSIGNDYVQSIAKTKDGIFWIGSLYGVNYWSSKQNFIHLLQKQEVMHLGRNNYTTSLLKTHSDELLIGTDASGIYKYSSDFSTLTKYSPLKVGEELISPGYVAGMIEDRNRNLWIISNEGLFIKPYDEDSFNFIKEAQDINGKTINLQDMSTIIETRDGDIWIGGVNQFFQIKVRRNSEASKTYSLEFTSYAELIPKSLMDTKYGVYTIYEDLQGYIWMGFSEGLIRFNPLSKRVEIFKSEPSNPQTLSNSDVTVIYEDLLGVLWVGTVSGLNRVRYNSKGNVYFQRVTEDDGFVDDFICSILADESGYLWVSTSNGLVKYHPDKGRPINFSYNDGLQFNEFFTNADLVDDEGNLYFGGVNGITLLTPNKVSIDKVNKTLKVTSIKQNDEVVRVTQQKGEYFARVHDEGVVTIELSIFDFINGIQSEYRYKIDAFGDDWVNLDGPTIRLHNLDQAQLLITAQARQKNGRWEEKEVILRLSVNKGFWASAQGFMLYLIALTVVVLGTAVYLARYFSRRLTEQEIKLDERKAQTQLLLSEKKTLLYQVEDLQYSLSEQRYLSERLEEKLERQSFTDQVTGFKSKHYLKQHIDKELANISQTWLENDGIAGVYLGVFAVDIDNLSMINKEHGPLCGNEILKQAAECLRTISYGTDTLVRWQGATLLILSRGIEKREQMILAEKIRSIIASRKFDLGNGASIDVTCSVGFGRFPFLDNPKEVITWEQLIYVINKALSVAKTNSRNAWLGIYTNQFSHPQEIRTQITTNLSGLLASGQLEYVSSIPKSNKIDWEC